MGRETPYFGTTRRSVTAPTPAHRCLPCRHRASTYDREVLGSDEAMSKGGIFWLAMAALSMIIAVAAATEGQWLAVAGFSVNMVSSVTLMVHYRRRSGRRL